MISPGKQSTEHHRAWRAEALVSGTVTSNQGAAPWTQRIQDGVGAPLATVTASNALKVDGSAVTQPVSGTVAATQSGTWTVQPGNTANTTAWKVDGSAVTQPVSGTVAATQSGTWTVQPGNTANTTAWKVDGSAVTQPVSGTVTANQGTANTAANAWFTKLTDGTNTTAVKAASTAAAAADPSAVVALSPNPAPQCTSVINFSQTASAQLITGTASQKLYFCSILVVSATAQNVSIVEGTGTTCATGISGLVGGSAASIALAANGGWGQTAGTPFMKSKTAADNLCLLQSGAGNVSGVISYVSAP